MDIISVGIQSVHINVINKVRFIIWRIFNHKLFVGEVSTQITNTDKNSVQANKLNHRQIHELNKVN